VSGPVERVWRERREVGTRLVAVGGIARLSKYVRLFRYLVLQGYGLWLFIVLCWAVMS
jgi:hypothetical protein